MEHEIPINKSMIGEHKLGNLVPSCKECNDKKHHKSYEDFLKNDQLDHSAVNHALKIYRGLFLQNH